MLSPADLPCGSAALRVATTWSVVPAERQRYPEHDRDRQSRAQVANLRARLRVEGPAVAGGRARAGAAEGQPRVRRAVGTARGRQALRGPQDPHPPRARPDRGGLPGAVHRGPVAGPAGAHRSPAHRGLREAATPRRPRPAALRRVTTLRPQRRFAYLSKRGARRTVSSQALEASLCANWVRRFRRSRRHCVLLGAAPRPELPTMTPMSVGRVGRGAGEDVVDAKPPSPRSPLPTVVVATFGVGHGGPSGPGSCWGDLDRAGDRSDSWAAG